MSIDAKQLKDLTVATAKLANGILSADAAGRAKVATNFFDATKAADAFANSSLPLGKLSEAVLQADGGQVWTGAQDAGGFDLNNLAAVPSGANSAASKNYVDQQATAGKLWRELVLISAQLDSTNDGILQAILALVATNPTDGDTFIITDGTTTETYEFDNNASVTGGNISVTIGGSPAATQTNLAAAITNNSALWFAVERTSFDTYFASTPSTQLVVYRRTPVADSTADRVYGTLAGGQSGIKVVEFFTLASGVQIGYERDNANEVNLPAADPAAKRFGFGRVGADLKQNETHLVADDNGTWTWDSDDAVWRQTDQGALAAGTGLSRTGNTIDVGAANGSIILGADDIQVAFGLGAAMFQIQAGTANNAGNDDAAARIDHQHGIATNAPDVVNQLGSTVAEGTNSGLARSDHRHSAGTPVAVGTANAEGTATTFSRSDHVHDAPAPTTADKDLAVGAGTSGDEAATGVTISNTPALDGYVDVKIDGVSYRVGDGVKTVDCYFSADGGTTAKAISAIVATDELIWNGTIAGFNLATTDRIDFYYETF